MIFSCLFGIIKSSVVLPEIDNDTLINICNSYNTSLCNTCTHLYEFPKIEETLVQDVKLKNLNSQDKKTVAVLDMGGTHFKIAIVSIEVKDGKLAHNLIDVKNFSYPAKNKFCRTIMWFDWVADLYINYLLMTKHRPDMCNLIFSYPVKYKNYKTSEALPIKFSKFWCFEEITSLSLDMLVYLNKAITEKAEDMEMQKGDYALAGSVLNDSVATLFSPKVFSHTEGVAIILGTGTNASFFINTNPLKYAYNSEWASYKSNAIPILDEERLVLSLLTNQYNLLDVLCGNGYKHFIYNTINKIRQLGLPEIRNNEIAEILASSVDDNRKQLLVQLMSRSRKILAAMVSAIIQKLDHDKIVLLLNGSGFCHIDERQKFLQDVKKVLSLINCDHIDIDVHYEDGLTFIGSAYYEYCKVASEVINN